MSTLFANQISEERPEASGYGRPMSTVKDVEMELMLLLGYLVGMIDDNCDTHKRAQEVVQEVTTDIFIPAIKTAYIDAIEYLLWGRMPYRERRCSSYTAGHTGYNNKYWYADREDDESEVEE